MDNIEKEIDNYLKTYFGSELEKQMHPFLMKMALHFYRQGIKQGEQKCINDLTSQESMDIAVAKCFEEQKSTDKVGSKFKVGDWITDGYVGGQITSIEDAYPCYKIADFMGGINTSIPFTVQDNYHLWTIQDAKDGDVLVDENVNVIGIFEGIEGMCWHSKLYYSSFTKELYGIECGGSHQKEFAKPATKEQRDLLFQKMKEAGYEWDAEKKELKQLSQSEATKISEQGWSEEDEDNLRFSERHFKTFLTNTYYDTFRNWLKSLKERLSKR